MLLNLVAIRREQQGDDVAAEALLQRAVQLAPDDFSVRNALGLCLLRVEQPGAALAHFDAVIRAHPALPFAHVNMGNALAALGLVSEAEAAYRRALAFDAEQPIAMSGLARIASSRGAWDEARKWADGALARLPGLPEAVMARAAVDLGAGDTHSAEGRLRALLEDSRLSVLERAHAYGALGDVLDAKNYVDEAFAAYASCNDALIRLYSGRYVGVGNALAYVQEVIRSFEAAGPDPRWRTRPARDLRVTGAVGHVFVLGFPRSGTTLLEVVLEGHPDVVSLEECESMIIAAQEHMQRPADMAAFGGVKDDELARLRAEYWRAVGMAGVDVLGKVFVDKNPLNTLKLPLIARLFPDAKVIFASRDPRDVVLSCFRHRFRMSAPIYELLRVDSAAKYYDAVMRAAVTFFSLLPLATCMVRHEDVVTDFKRELTRICAFLGIEWDPAMSDFALRAKKRESITPSTSQLVKGLNTEGLGQWIRYRGHLQDVFPTLEPWVKRFLYEP